ncbi:MAG: phospholipase D-like domain-containing protein [Steroidobacteraceae bacterium]
MVTVEIIVLSALATALIMIIGINFVTSEKRLARRPRRLYDIEDVDFTRALGVLLGPSITSGNRIEALVNGVEIFPAMLEAIGDAEHTITFETFIFWSDPIANKFQDALCAASRRGVRVHVHIDWVGSQNLGDGIIPALKDAGVEVEIYHPLSWYHLHRMNNRTHRKLMIIDGWIGFTGGVGIAEIWTGNAEDEDHWRDTHYRVEGPVVAQMQAAFLDNWMKTTGRVLHGDRYFPDLEPAGHSRAQMFASSPQQGAESMQLMVAIALGAASREIWIQNAYFVPDALTTSALIAASRRGVAVRIMVPGGKTDAHIVRHASQAQWGKLLAAGVEIYEYQRTMMHCKVMVIDQVWTSIGSANFDTRSFRVNDEANLNVWDGEFARVQLALIENDLCECRAYNYERWRRRPLWRRSLERAASLLRSQL